MISHLKVFLGISNTNALSPLVVASTGENFTTQMQSASDPLAESAAEEAKSAYSPEKEIGSNDTFDKQASPEKSPRHKS
jgi:hypothetical protein